MDWLKRPYFKYGWGFVFGLNWLGKQMERVYVDYTNQVKIICPKCWLEKNKLADCLENDKPFRIQIAGERINIPSKAIFNIEHEREGNMEEVEFQFKWKRD